MNVMSFENKLNLLPHGKSISYINQYNNFWAWKIKVETQNDSHILDSEHIKDTSDKLLDILPRWQTYRGIKCNFRKELPSALSTISDAYNIIRQYSLLEFEQIPDEPLRLIWDTLGSIKDKNEINSTNAEHFVISICKPLMFIWGQTLAFDSINRQKLQNDSFFKLTDKMIKRSRWSYSFWKQIMNDISKKISTKSPIIYYCQSYSLHEFGSDFLIPYGRILDIYYYYRSAA